MTIEEEVAYLRLHGVTVLKCPHAQGDLKTTALVGTDIKSKYAAFRLGYYPQICEVENASEIFLKGNR